MTEQVAHWIADDTVRKRFWGYAKSELGLTDNEVHGALEVRSVKDYGGTMQEARTALDAYASDPEARLIHSLMPSKATHAESSALAFCDVYAPDGTRVSVTARQGATADDVAYAALALWGGLDYLRKVGWHTNGKRRAANGNRAAVKPTPKSAPTPAPQPQAPPTPPTSGGNGQGDGGSETFLVESITAQVSPNGNRYYAIRGGRVKKHGASAWPEVAEPQLLTLLEYDIKNLEVGKPWEVVEWNIQAVGEIEAGKKYPNKVTAFAPAVEG